jgi:hypothetical protein
MRYVLQYKLMLKKRRRQREKAEKVSTEKSLEVSDPNKENEAAECLTENM